MNFFKKRTTLLETMTYMACMAAINVMFVLLTTLQPWLMFLIVFVLPLTSTIVTLYCKKRYFIIYAVTTVSLCMLATIWNISDTLFYVIPSLISGFLFGVFILKGIPISFIIFVSSIVQFIFSYLMIPVINFLTNIDIVLTFTKAFNVDNLKYIDYVVPAFIFFLSLTQSGLSFAIIKDELPKFHFDSNKYNKKFEFLNEAAVFIFCLLSLIFAFLHNIEGEKIIFGPISYLFMFMALYFSIYVLLNNIIKGNKFIYFSLCGSVFVFFILFGAFYSLITPPLGLLLLEIEFIFISLISLSNILFIRVKNKDKIKTEGEN